MKKNVSPFVQKHWLPKKFCSDLSLHYFKNVLLEFLKFKCLKGLLVILTKLFYSGCSKLLEDSVSDE